VFKVKNQIKSRMIWIIICCLIGATSGLAACQPSIPLEAEYVDEEYGFSIKYPAEYAEEKPRSNEVFRARTPDRFPLLAITILHTEVGTSFTQLKDTFESGLAVAGIADVEFLFEKEITLPDGVTPAYELEIEYSFGGYDLRTLYLWTVKHDKWFLVGAATVVDSWILDCVEWLIGNWLLTTDPVF